VIHVRSLTSYRLPGGRLQNIRFRDSRETITIKPVRGDTRNSSTIQSP
jgi:hypothetical protein